MVFTRDKFSGEIRGKEREHIARKTSQQRHAKKQEGKKR